MGFSKKQLFREINEGKRYLKPDYIRASMDKIDRAVEDAELDDAFFEEYYKLKKWLDGMSTQFPAIIVGLIPSAIISFSFNSFTLGAVFALLVIAGVCLWLVDYSITKQWCVLEPYLLKKMRERIEDRPHLPPESSDNTSRHLSSKDRFWKWMLTITLASLVATFVFGSEIPWTNLRLARFSWSIAKSILYDISVGVFSSMILVWCIDRIQLQVTEKQAAKQRAIVYNKLGPLLTDYYNFYLFLYIATRDTPVEANNEVLTSLYSCRGEFFGQIRKTDPFYKDGYYGDPAKYKAQMALLEQHSGDAKVLEQVMKMSTSFPWYTCWEIEGSKFYDGVSQIEKDFPTFFANELLEMIDELLVLVQPQKNLVNFVEGKYMPTWAANRVKMALIPTEMFIDAYHMENILCLLDRIMVYIEEDSSKKLRGRDLSFFNDRNVCPTLGHSCAETQMNTLDPSLSADSDNGG